MAQHLGDPGAGLLRQLFCHLALFQGAAVPHADLDELVRSQLDVERLEEGVVDARLPDMYGGVEVMPEGPELSTLLAA